MTAKPVIRGKHVVLRPLTVTDAEAMFASLNDEEAKRLTGTQKTHSLADVEAHLKRCEASDDRFDFAILSEGHLVGEVVLSNVDPLNKSASFRIAVWYAENRNRGYGSEATELVVRFGFECLGLNRIELEVFAFNPRARYVYERAGFVHEGVRRQALFWEGQWVDSEMMAVLRTDFDKA